MLIFDLTFTDGKRCRYLCPDPEATVESERADLEAMFCGRLASMSRIIAPPPEKLPWKRVANDRWELHSFELRRCADDPDGSNVWCLSYADQILYANDKDVISRAVRENWSKGC